MIFPPVRRIAAAIIATLGAGMLTGCFMIPGNFDARLDLRSDGSFTYNYTGEIRLLGLTQLAEMSNRNEAIEWDSSFETCWDYSDEQAMKDEATEEPEPDQADGDQVVVTQAVRAASGSERPCSEEELAEKRENFEAGQERRKERQEQEARQMQAMFGGIDPSDPEAGKQIAQRLARQHGWNKVEYRGEGLFEVEFAITSRIDHDFSFPMMEGMTTGQPFFYVFRREGDTIRVDAPGFARGLGEHGAGPGAGGGSAYWLMMAGAFGDGNSRDAKMMEMLKGVSGIFTLTTDGEILANNTDEGYRDVANGRELVWRIDSMDDAPPSALIRLTR